MSCWGEFKKMDYIGEVGDTCTCGVEDLVNPGEVLYVSDVVYCGVES